jgi:hypothetical protein
MAYKQLGNININDNQCNTQLSSPSGIEKDNTVNKLIINNMCECIANGTHDDTTYKNILSHADVYVYITSLTYAPDQKIYRDDPVNNSFICYVNNI